MNKQEFIEALSKKLEQTLSRSEIEKTISYYEEVIADRMEDGEKEEEAVAALGTLDEIVKEIVGEQSLPSLVCAKVNNSKEKAQNKVLWIVLAIITSPIWFPIAIGMLSVILTLYLIVWVLIASLYTIVISFALSGVAGLVSGVLTIFTSGIAQGIFVIGVSMCLIAIAAFLAYPVFFISKQLIRFTGFLLKKIKYLFIKK